MRIWMFGLPITSSWSGLRTTWNMTMRIGIFRRPITEATMVSGWPWAMRILIFGLLVAVSAAQAGSEPPRKSGVQLWRENCGSCHNLHNTKRYSDAEWEVVATHMRIRANLPAEEVREILKFLKAAN